MSIYVQCRADERRTLALLFAPSFIILQVPDSFHIYDTLGFGCNIDDDEYC
jgi:hypothetical protein